MNLQAAINSYVVEDDPKICNYLAADLVKNSTLLEIVKELETPLTQEDSLVRAKATQCITDVIYQHSSLKPQEIQVLSIFLSDRLDDNDSVSPAASGLRALSKKAAFKPFGEDSDLWEKLSSINMLQLDIDSRYEVYMLLNSLAANATPTFVQTFVSLVSGEKDPRNLLLNLSTVQQILSKIGNLLPSELLSSIYDITFCYFPIKFNPPKDMPYEITGAELRKSLLDTLSNQLLAKWVIPGVISKLTAVNVNVKLDALATLDKTLDNLAVDGKLSEYWPVVWDGTKFEVLHGTPDNETYKPVIGILQKFVLFPKFLDEVLNELKSESIPKARLYQICNLVVGISTTHEVWEVLAPTAVKKCFESPNALILFLKTEYPIPYPDLVFQALQTALANGEKRDSIYGLTRFANSPNCSEYVPLIIQILTQESAYPSLAKIAKLHARHIQDYCLPHLLAQLPESLDALGEVCCVKSLVHALTVRLLSCIDMRDKNKPGSPTALQLLSTLIKATSHLQSASDFMGYDRVLRPTIFNMFRDVSESGQQPKESVIDAACILLERAARGVALDQQDSYVADVIKDLGNVHFHLILSALVPMEKFPFTNGFFESFVFPKLETTSSILERAAYLRLMAVSTNKWPDNVATEVDTGKLCDEIKEAASKDNVDPNKVEIFLWITKGLVFRCDQLGFKYAMFVTEQAARSPVFAKAYGVMIADDRTLVKSNHCIIRTLFKQRLFVTSLPVLAKDAGSRESLIAVSSLLKYTPHNVVANYFNQLLPMLVTSLNTNSMLLQETALQCLNSSLPDSADALESKIHILIPRILEIGRTSTSGKARMLAMKTLISLRNSMPGKFAAFKVQVLDEVEPILGDKKRDVRKHAVKCRQACFSL